MGRYAAGLALALILLTPVAEAADHCMVPPLEAKSASAGSADHLIERGEDLVASGFHAQGVRLLERAVGIANRSAGQAQRAKALGALGHALMLTGDETMAMACLDQSLEIAEAERLVELEALAHLNKGSLYREDDKPGRAVDSFSRALDIALEAERPDLQARALLNRARLAIDVRNTRDLVRDLDLVAVPIAALEDGEEKASLLIAQGAGFADDLLASETVRVYDERAYAAFAEALTVGDALASARLRSEALGELAALYAGQDRTDEALALFDQALAEARQIKADGLTSRWSWKRAGLNERLGHREDALADYKRAVDITKALREQAAIGGGALGRRQLKDAQALLTDYLDFLFAEDDGALDENALKRIRALVEEQRQVEVESYFRDDCVADLRSRIRPIEEISESGVAVLYSIFSKDRLILLTGIGESLAYDEVPIDEERLEGQIRRLRRSLPAWDSTPAEYLPTLQALHALLIEPIEVRLEDAGVDTLVIVPTGALRAVPFAALHDGETYLVTRFATAIAPGLSLLDSASLSDRSAQTLLGGLTEPVAGFEDLRFVEVEVEQIRELRGGTMLVGENFKADELERSLAQIPYRVVHFASHASFGKSPSETFVLLRDGKIDLDRLEAMMRPNAFRDRPIELLTLSACKTATADLERAALGLAGVAVKAGARSALGALWNVVDESSPKIMRSFYEALGQEGQTKAKALQHAQLSLLEDQDFSHPAFWAPYLLIGNWR